MSFDVDKYRWTHLALACSISRFTWGLTYCDYFKSCLRVLTLNQTETPLTEQAVARFILM
jgi:hypothetical protein